MTIWKGYATYVPQWTSASAAKIRYTAEKQRDMTAEEQYQSLWKFKPGEIFFLPGEKWSNYLGLSKTERRAMVLEGESQDEYLSAREHVAIWDNLTNFDSDDLGDAGVDFRAYSKVFKILYNREMFGVLDEALQNMWKPSVLKDKAFTDILHKRNEHLIDKNVGEKQWKSDAKGLTFCLDIKKRYEFMAERTGLEDSTAIFKLVIASVIAKPKAFKPGKVAYIAELAESFDIDVIFNLILDGAQPYVVRAMLEYDIDRDLAEAMSL